MKTLQEKRREFLNETVGYFNTHTRAEYMGNCLYSPVGVSEGCAIGRKIADKALCKQFDELRGSVTNPKIFQALPEDLQELGMDFLFEIQKLHDFPLHWTENGLSEAGIERVKRIEEIFIN